MNHSLAITKNTKSSNIYKNEFPANGSTPKGSNCLTFDFGDNRAIPLGLSNRNLFSITYSSIAGTRRVHMLIKKNFPVIGFDPGGVALSSFDHLL